jgi:anthranilate phosphoribosyltransferase
VNEAIRVAIERIVAGERLTSEQMEAAIGAVLDGEAQPSQLGAILIGLRMRGETTAELTGFVRAMRARVVPVDAPPGAVDTCGTGGDVHATFNISTAAALVVAAAGVPVAKHGNRAVTSKSGSSDAIGALGVTVEQGPEEAAASLREDGFAFLHAPLYHPGMRHAGPVRRELGVRTAFNLCGPLANPASPRFQLVGVAEPASAERMAEVLQALGLERAFVVHGDRVDELPLDDSGVIYDVTPARIERREVQVAPLGLARADTAELAGAEPAENAALIEAIVRGRRHGSARDVVLLNAGAALLVAGAAPDLRTGVELAASTIDSGAASDRLERLRAREQERARAAAEAAVAQGAMTVGGAPATMPAAGASA